MRISCLIHNLFIKNKNPNYHAKECQIYLYLIADNEAPLVSCPNNVPAMNVDAGMAYAIITWSPLPSANDTVDGIITTIVCNDGAGNVVMSGDRFAVGTTTVTCRANDSIPLEGSCQFNITVVGKCCQSDLIKNIYFHCGFRLPFCIL